MGRWVATATAVTGNPVKLIQIGIDELTPSRTRRAGWLQEASDQGIVLTGKPLPEVLSHLKGGRRHA